MEISQRTVTGRHKQTGPLSGASEREVNSSSKNHCQKKQKKTGHLHPLPRPPSSTHRGELFILACSAELPLRGDSAPGVAMQLLRALLMRGTLKMFRSFITLSRTYCQRNFFFYPSPPAPQKQWEKRNGALNHQSGGTDYDSITAKVFPSSHFTGGDVGCWFFFFFVFLDSKVTSDCINCASVTDGTISIAQQALWHHRKEKERIEKRLPVRPFSAAADPALRVAGEWDRKDDDVLKSASGEVGIRRREPFTCVRSRIWRRVTLQGSLDLNSNEVADVALHLERRRVAAR